MVLLPTLHSHHNNNNNNTTTTSSRKNKASASSSTVLQCKSTETLNPVNHNDTDYHQEYMNIINDNDHNHTKNHTTTSSSSPSSSLSASLPLSHELLSSIHPTIYHRLYDSIQQYLHTILINENRKFQSIYHRLYKHLTSRYQNELTTLKYQYQEEIERHKASYESRIHTILHEYKNSNRLISAGNKAQHSSSTHIHHVKNVVKRNIFLEYECKRLQEMLIESEIKRRRLEEDTKQIINQIKNMNPHTPNALPNHINKDDDVVGTHHMDGEHAAMGGGDEEEKQNQLHIDQNDHSTARSLFSQYENQYKVKNNDASEHDSSLKMVRMIITGGNDDEDDNSNGATIQQDSLHEPVGDSSGFTDEDTRIPARNDEKDTLPTALHIHGIRPMLEYYVSTPPTTEKTQEAAPSQQLSHPPASLSQIINNDDTKRHESTEHHNDNMDNDLLKASGSTSATTTVHNSGVISYPLHAVDAAGNTAIHQASSFPSSSPPSPASSEPFSHAPLKPVKRNTIGTQTDEVLGMSPAHVPDTAHSQPQPRRLESAAALPSTDASSSKAETTTLHNELIPCRKNTRTPSHNESTASPPMDSIERVRSHGGTRNSSVELDNPQHEYDILQLEEPRTNTGHSADDRVTATSTVSQSTHEVTLPRKSVTPISNSDMKLRSTIHKPVTPYKDSQTSSSPALYSPRRPHTNASRVVSSSQRNDTRTPTQNITTHSALNQQHLATISSLKQQIKHLEESERDVRRLLEGKENQCNEFASLKLDQQEQIMSLQAQLEKADKLHTDMIQRTRQSAAVKKKELKVKLNEKDQKIDELQKIVDQFKITDSNFKASLFHLQKMQSEVTSLQRDVSDRDESIEKLKVQLHGSLDTIKEIEENLVSQREDHLSYARKLKKRLVVKSVWFRSQLLKLNRLVEICMNVDNTLSAEFTCVLCLNKMKSPVILPCGHSMCKNCLPAALQNQGPSLPINNGEARQSDIRHQCPHCRVLCDSYLDNHTLDSVLTRFNWSSVVLNDARTNLALTQANEFKTRNMVVTSIS